MSVNFLRLKLGIEEVFPVSQPLLQTAEQTGGTGGAQLLVKASKRVAVAPLFSV